MTGTTARTSPVPIAPGGAPAEGAPAPPALTKIVATVGPASSSADVLEPLIEAGVSVFRLNFGHGTLEDHARRLAVIRTASARLDRHTAVLGDLQGPRIRLGPVADGPIEIERGATLIIGTETGAGAAAGAGGPTSSAAAAPPGALRLTSTYGALADDVEAGHRLLINDGTVRTLVVEKRPGEVLCRVTYGGTISTGKGINLPDSHVSAPTLTERDWTHVEWAIEHDLDFLALSFVRSAADVVELAEGIERAAERRGRRGLRVPIIAKIETPSAVAGIEAIVESADGIMVARGDLGVEMDLAQVPVIQKRLVAVAQEHGKPSIVATQMLESMINAPAPTRAEANDVAGAIFDEADAVMLSGETAVGRYPVLAVEHMRRIAHYTEDHLAEAYTDPSPPARLRRSGYRTAALAHGAWVAARDMDARVIAVWSQSGGGARYLSQNNFQVPIVGFTTDPRAARQMQILRGVTPVVMDVPGDLEAFAAVSDRYLLDHGIARAGDVCILVAGMPLGTAGVTDTMAIHRVQ